MEIHKTRFIKEISLQLVYHKIIGDHTKAISYCQCLMWKHMQQLWSVGTGLQTPLLCMHQKVQ